MTSLTRLRPLLGLLLLLPCATPRRAEAALRFRVELSEIANLTYQLDCLGGLAQCEAEDYRALWERELLKTPADRARLAEWVRLRNRYDREVGLDAEEPAPLAGGAPTLDLGEKIRIAGLQANDLDDYLGKLDLLVLPADRAAFARVLRAVLPAFDGWWQGGALERGQPFPAYNLLNEGLASAFGNGMIERAVAEPGRFARMLAKEGSFYNNASIDRAAKALLPFLDGWLAAGKTLFDPEFVPAYVRTLRAAFGPSLTAPRLYLAEMALVVDETLGGELRRVVRKELRVASMYSSEGAWDDPQTLGEYRKYQSLNALLLVRSENLVQLVKQKILTPAEGKTLAARVAKEGKALYAFERRKGSGTYAFVLVAKDEATVQGLLEKLGKAEASFLGFYGGR